MMKNFKKFTAFVLALCMLFSLSVAAFAAEADVHTVYDSALDEEIATQSETAASGTIPGSKIKWELNEHNWLMISGSGDCEPFTSKDDQPWAAVRDQITQVWFDDMDALHITDLAYWFEDCTNLTTAEIPGTTPVIGRHAFYNCPKLSTLTIYYGEDILESIGEDAFWRETDSGDTLYIGYLIGYPKSSVPFHTYNWGSSNRNERYFYDLYGSNSSRTMSASDVSLTSTGTIIGNCPSCGKYSFQGVYVEVAHSSRGHANYNECYLCHYVQYEDAAHHNAVFIGTDEGGCPRHAHLRSTNSFGKAFRLNVEASDPRCSFHHTGTDGRLYVFEAPIDLLSYISMHPDNWQVHSYVACCGTSPQPVLQMLKPDTELVYLCLDNDDAGHAASKRMAELLHERGVDTQRLVPELKDWNDDLLNGQREELAPCLSL
ncbi:MAG: toprim domain-containing protein [Oscillospiraceae bacterium]